MTESPRSPEEFEQDLIDALKTDFDSPATKEMLNQWCEEQEKIADQAEDAQKGRVELELKRAHLYSLAGFQEDAEMTWNDALDMASNFGRDDLITLIRTERQKYS